MRKLLLVLVRCLGRLAFVGTLLWVVGAARYSEIGPDLFPHALALVILIGVPTVWFSTRQKRRVAWIFVAVAAAAVVAWQFKRPSNDRNWATGVDQQARIEIDGDQVTLSQLRDFRYRGPGEPGVRYYSRSLDVRTVRDVDFVVERFHALDGLAHTMLSFGFANGERVCVSIEIRRERGEDFDPVAGFFKQYELIYVVGSEQDLIGLRTNHRHSDVWMFPIKTTLARKRTLFVDMLRRAAALQEEPEFYNSLTSSCTTNIVDHVCALAPNRVPFDWRVYVPGYSGALAYDLDLIDTALSFEDAQKHFRIDEIAQQADIGSDFSERIRSGRSLD